MKQSQILFVCLGNICRSPIAEGIARNIVQSQGLNIDVDSAGTSDWHKGEHPCAHSISVAKHHSIDISRQKSRPISKEDIEHYEHVIAMDEQNRIDLVNFGFKNVYKLGDFGGFKGQDVPDPYFFPGFEGFDKVFNMVNDCVSDFLEKKCK